MAATAAQVSAIMANGGSNSTNGSGGNAIASVQEQAQAALASAASEASSPQADQDTRQTADTATRMLARASWFSYAALVVGAIISIVSGAAGFRHQPSAEDTGGPARRADPLADRTVPAAQPVR